MITIPSNTKSRVCIPAKTTSPKDECHVTIERIGYSIKETMQSLGVSKMTVCALIKQGKIQSIKVGKRRIVSVQSLRDFVDGKKEKPCESGKEIEKHRARKHNG